MAKLTLADVSNLMGNPTSAANTINANSDLIETALENTLSRDGTTPNQMEADIDLNNNDLLNVNLIDAQTFSINGGTDFQGLIDEAAASASAASVSATNASNSADDAAQSALEAESALVFNRVAVQFVTSGVGPYDMGVGNDIVSNANLEIFIEGEKKAVDQYTISGTTFTLTTDPGAGLGMEAIITADNRVLNAPADGSVITLSIVDDAVTKEKLSSEVLNLLGGAYGQFDIRDYGGDSALTPAENKTALQSAISACDAAGGGTVLVPWPIDYGYTPTDLSTHPDFTGVVNDMMVLDHGPAAVGYPSAGAKQGWMEKRWNHTPQTTPVGQHDGNGFRVLADWHPYLWVDANPAVVPLGSRDANYNYRASLYFGLRGAAVYQMQMGNGQGDVSDDNLKGLNWIAYNGDGSFRHALISFEYGSGRMAYGALTNLPESNHQFRMQDTAASTAMFQSQLPTNQVFFRNSEGSGSDVGFSQTTGGAFEIFKAGVGGFMSWDTNRHASTGGNLTVNGVLSKTSGTFDIAHPDPVKTETHRLRHSFVESPTRGDNIYRYSVEVGDDLSAVISLPDYWSHLNENPQVWVNASTGMGRGFGVVSPDSRSLHVTTDASGTYNVLLIGTRKDAGAVDGWDQLGVEYEVIK